MAKSLSYQEALTQGLVYPGSEQEALKLTGGGKGFASSEAFKKAFDTSYQAKKSEVDALTGKVQSLADINKEANRLWSAAMGASTKAYGGALNRYYGYVQSTDFYKQTSPSYARWYRVDQTRDLINREIDRLASQQKGLSGTMEQAMAKYKATSEKAVEAEKRETGAATAARKRLTRGTAGLLAKAGGAGGMVGTGLPMLGEGTSSQLGEEGQLGKRVKL
jgi:hypothetical protein